MQKTLGYSEKKRNIVSSLFSALLVLLRYVEKRRDIRNSPVVFVAQENSSFRGNIRTIFNGDSTIRCSMHGIDATGIFPLPRFFDKPIIF